MPAFSFPSWVVPETTKVIFRQIFYLVFSVNVELLTLSLFRIHFYFIYVARDSSIIITIYFKCKLPTRHLS